MLHSLRSQGLLHLVGWIEGLNNMRVSFVLVLALLLSSVAFAQDAQQTLVLTQRSFNDPLSSNMASHTILAPKGWKAEGGAFWPGAKLFRIHPSQRITLTAPDGRQAVLGPSFGGTDLFPSQVSMQNGFRRPAEGQIDNGTPVLHMPQSLEQWAQWVAAKGLAVNYQGAENIECKSIEVVPELTQLLHRQMQPIVQQQNQQNQQAAQFGLNQQAWCNGAVYAARYTYDLDGRTWEQLYVWGVSVVGLDSDAGRQLWWSVEPNVSFRAQAGQLDQNLPLMISLLNSARMTPQWAKMKADHLAALNAIDRKGFADRQRIIAQSNAEIREIIQQGYENRQAINDKGHHSYINSVREVNEYTVPGSETKVELPSHYDHVYSNGNGEYILTNDANYNPNRDNSVNNLGWETMKTVE